MQTERTEKKKGDMPSNGWGSTGSTRGAARCLDHLKLLEFLVEGKSRAKVICQIRFLLCKNQAISFSSRLSYYLNLRNFDKQRLEEEF